MAGFSGNLAFNVFPQVDGISASFDQSSAQAGQTVNLHLLASENTAPGSYLFTVTATGGGKTRATSLWLNVLDPAVTYVSSPANVSQTPGYTFIQNQPQVDQQGNIHAVFYDDTDLGPHGFKVYYARSTDGGLTYPNRVQLSRDGDLATAPILKLGQNGQILVAWAYTRFNYSDGRLQIPAANIGVARSLDGGETFSPAADLSATSLTFPVLGSLDVNDDGSVVITYTRPDVVGQRLWAIWSGDGGATFGSPVQISSPGQNPMFMSTLSDKRGTFFAIYEGFDSTTDQTPIFASRSGDGGKTFVSTAIMISPAAILVTQPPVSALGPDGIPYVVYRGFSIRPTANSTIFLASDPGVNILVAPDGKNFAPPSLIAADAFVPSVAVDKSGAVYVSYGIVEAGPGTNVFFQPLMLTRSTDKAASFSIPVRVSDVDGFAITNTAMALDANGNLGLTWSDQKYGGSAQVVLTTSADGGVTFSPQVNVSGNQAYQFSPSFWPGPTARSSCIGMATRLRTVNFSQPCCPLSPRPRLISRCSISL